MSCVSLSDRIGPFGNPVSRKNSGALTILQGVGIQAQKLRQRLVEYHQIRLAHRYLIQPSIKSLRQACIAVVEIPSCIPAALFALDRHGILQLIKKVCMTEILSTVS